MKKIMTNQNQNDFLKIHSLLLNHLIKAKKISAESTTARFLAGFYGE